MLHIIQSVRAILSHEERCEAVRVTLLALILAVVETFGVASVIPFLAVAGDPEIIQRSEWLGRIYTALGFSSQQVFMLALGTVSAVIITVGAGFRLAVQYVVTRFVSGQRHILSMRLFESYLGRPYSWFLDRNGADLAKGVLQEAQEVASGLIKPLMDLVTNGLVILLLVGFLITIDPAVAVSVGLAVTCAYSIVYMAIRGIAARMGDSRVEANSHRFTLVSEAFESIKTLKMRGVESYYLERFRRPSHEIAQVQARHLLVQQLPRYAIETTALAVILGLAAVLVISGRELAGVFPVLGAWALAGYRLLPAFQRAFASIVQIRFGMAALRSFAGEMETAVSATDTLLTARYRDRTPIALSKGLHLRGITFCYPGTTREALAPVDLFVDACTSVGIVGATGAGKTTLVDLVAGLLEPSAGEICVDTVPLDVLGRRQWRQSVGYVPQFIHMIDATLAENIAFGLAPHEIDPVALERASRLAQLHPFVEAQLPAGYQTRVGERGVRLSGGERQRVGIARALYFDPSVLILDEGTSALDGVTELAVLEAIRKLRHQKTILIVAHRLSTVQECDRILVLENGRLVADGDWASLLTFNPIFQEFAGAGEVG